jgi:hypothetical protein
MVGAACALVAAAGISWRSWLGSPAGLLAWDGEAWAWTASRDPEPGTLQAVLDLQDVLLLRWHAASGVQRWLWAERRVQPATWDDLRRAVYSRARPGGGSSQALGEGRT